LLAFIALIGFVTAALAGGYPAFYLSSFHASKVFRGPVGNSGRSSLRKFLTIGQFGIATIMIIGTLIVFKQMNHMKNASLGFDKELVISFPVPPELNRNFDTFKASLLEHSGVKAVTLCGGVPGRTLSHWSYRFPDGESDNAGINTIVMDYDYLDVIGLEIKEGRAFSREISTDDSLAYLLNETAVRKFGLANPVGTRFQVMDGRHGVGEIVGVVKDFHYRSLQHQVDPLVMRIERDNAWLAAVKLTPGDVQNKLEFMKREWNKVAGPYPFYYSFLDEDFDTLYRSEEKIGVIMSTFSTLAIVVACLGLLGLTSFFTEQRKREIGIRKVHGASIRDIIRLLSWDFIKLVLVGFLVTAPLAWYIAEKWLENFAYRTSIDPLIFIVSGIALGVLALVTVSYQSYKSSRCNPVDVLKDT
jgi:putative ABC transport system permease protein